MALQNPRTARTVYYVVVKTSTMPNAGTDARVYIDMHGEHVSMCRDYAVTVLGCPVLSFLAMVGMLARTFDRLPAVLPRLYRTSIFYCRTSHIIQC